ncbi:glycosyltransferase family 2 protein [Janthinobacterium sp. LB3P112]|uniref:glycosyltransferase family 2 protein n=1 Tax=Janthinobacterium sp. LB3P112 TaxID=3424196 RepID=UPI003F24E933
MTLPLVSILIPVFNREQIIAQTLDSALSQTYIDFEIVVVDNFSTDGTWGILQEYAEKHDRVRVFRNAENIGPVRNWLACVSKARGIFSKILWSDDLIHADFLWKVMPYMADPDVGFVYSATRIFTGNNKNSGNTVFSSLRSGSYASTLFQEGALLNGDFPVSPGCAVFRTADLQKNLLLHVPNSVDSDFSMHAIGNDLLIFLLTAKNYKKFAVVAEPLSYFRSHTGSITISSASGKIPLHYDLAKGFFLEQSGADEKLLMKVAAMFRFHMLRYDARKFGIVKLADFFPSQREVYVSLSLVIKIAFRMYIQKLRGLFLKKLSRAS